MPEIPNTWNILKSARRNDYFVIIGITLTFILIIAAGLHFVFDKMAHQTESVEQMKLDGIRDDFREMLAESENMTLRVATSTEQILAYHYSDDALVEFFEQQQHLQKQIPHIECTRIYMIDQDLNSLPYFDEPSIFRIIRLALYRMASKNPNTVLTLEPQIDPSTGEMQITMAKLLSDDQTVIALNFKLVDMQEVIERMVSNKKATALITAGNGIIIANSNMDLVGARILKKLPEYESVFERILDPRSHDNFQVTIDGTSRTIFSSEIRDGWQMILSIESFDLYRNDYMQILYIAAIALILLTALIFLYLFGLKNRLHAEQSLHVQEEFLSRLSRELREPLLRILKISDIGTLKGESGISENAAQVRESAIQLSNMLDNLFSYSNIVLKKKEVREDNSTRILQLSRISRMARTGIVAVLILAMIGSLTVCLRATMNLGDTKMNAEIDKYNDYFSTWITRRRTIMNMFVDTLTERPELVSNYYDTVRFLADISKHYSEIYVCYIANPDQDWKFASNTDYRIPPDFQIERQQWYINAEEANGELAISSPYYSERTGNYCITFSQMIYDRSGEFIGVLGIDFFINDLMQFFSESYRENGYAFLVDGNGLIINHPSSLYQMSRDVKRNIFETEYESAYSSDETVTLEDYSGKYVACLAKKNPLSDFGVVIVNRWWNNIYGNNIIIGLIFIAVFGGFIGVVIILINRLIRWQNNVQNQLTEAANAAVAAGQAKSQFLAQMSHEIRTPINAVLGMNEMILRESDDEEILNYSENIQRAGRILLNLINNILDFSKIEDGKMEIIPTQYETTVLISDLVNMISERARKKNLELRVEIDPSLPKVLHGDDVRIRQVIINILTNAVKYTPTGSVTLSMGGSIVADDKLALCVVVKDTGIGIREEDMDKLFQSFQRLDEEKNRNIEGTGLGISIVQKLLTMMGSHLEVESVYGEGSTFSFIIEQKIIDKTPIGNYRDRDSVSRKKSDTYLRAPDAKILVVDDNDMNLKVIKGLLKRSGIKPDLVSSGKECLERVKDHQYDIIFLDHMMPEMDGIETLQHLKESNDLPDSTTVIILTANAISGAREMYIEAGFKDYLTKPIEIDALEKMIARYLPDEMVSFEDPKKSAKKSKSESKSKSKVEEIFDAREIKKFAEICPEIDLGVGLSNCMEDRDFLFEMMEEFIANDKTSELDKLFESKDLKNYQIQTHALKSTAQVIGAVEVSEIAKSLESLAKDQKFDESKHHDLLKKYRDLLHHLKLIFGIEEESVDQIEESFESRIEKICPEIDLKVGMSNCMEDPEFLREMMEEFIANDKTSELEKLFESKDLKNYQIQTHALKSTAQVIGAIEVSEIAKSLEMLAKDQKFDESKHHELIEKYQQLLKNLREIFKIDEIAPEKSSENSSETFEDRIARICPEINLKIGLSNCMEDPEFLREMMEEFIANDKTSELEKLFESKDLKNYQIQTHALKSTAQVIGAVEVSEIAKSLEMLAKDQKFDESKHHELIEKYQTLLANLKSILEE